MIKIKRTLLGKLVLESDSFWTTELERESQKYLENGYVIIKEISCKGIFNMDYYMILKRDNGSKKVT